MENNIVLCKHVQSPHLLEEYGVRPARIAAVMEEARELCTPAFTNMNQKFTAATPAASRPH